MVATLGVVATGNHGYQMLLGGKHLTRFPMRTNLGAWSAGLASSGVLEMSSRSATRKTLFVLINRLYGRCSTYCIQRGNHSTLDF